MEEDGFGELAGLMCDVVINNRNITDKVKAFRKRFSELRFCFKGEEFDNVIQRLHGLL